MEDINIHKDNIIIDITDIVKMIPHRYPFLLVDRVKDLSLDDSIIGIKNVSMNEPFFQGLEKKVHS